MLALRVPTLSVASPWRCTVSCWAHSGRKGKAYLLYTQKSPEHWTDHLYHGKGNL